MLFIACSSQAHGINNISVSGDTSKPLVGGGCEGCEAIYESPIPFAKLNWIDTLPDYFEAGLKLMISGTIYKAGGKTPAPNTILYIYHADQIGHYTSKGMRQT
ncbi:MAG: hypothetical protein ABJA71_13585 [Ginsengibacter sp.]